MQSSTTFLSSLWAILLQSLGVVLLAAIVSGCALSSSGKKKSVVKECILPDDQKSTLLGRWKVLPIPVAIEMGGSGASFSAEEAAQIVEAAKGWNDYYEAALGIKVLDFGSETSPNENNTPRPADPCRQGILVGEQFTGQVVVRVAETWPYPNPEAMAIAQTCRIPATPVRSIYNAVIDVNYENFFVEGKRVPDLVSIVRHEFGHLLGLNHSCEATGTAGVPDCDETSALPASYFEALMFPTFNFVNGVFEQRRELNDNDQGRGYCLYQDKGSAN